MVELYSLRSLRVEDLDAVIQIHNCSFPGFFLTFLGPGFLRLLYRNIAADPEGILLVAEVDNTLAGFVAGVTHQNGFYRRLIQRQKWAFAWAAGGAVARRPSILTRLWRALRRPAEAAESAAETW